MVDADLVECIVSLPGQLFYSTQIPVSLWFLNRDKSAGGSRQWRDRQREVLFIDTRKLGNMVDRTHREFSDDDIREVASTYHSWRGEPGSATYEDIPGFSSTVTIDEIARHRYVLTPGRYVGTEAAEEEDEPIADKIKRLRRQLDQDFEASNALQSKVLAVLDSVDLP
jgi:type I restriction enzyme M protein